MLCFVAADDGMFECRGFFLGKCLFGASCFCELVVHIQQNGDVQFAAAAEVQAWVEAITINNECIRTGSKTKPPAIDRIIFNDTDSSPPQLDSPIGVFGV